MLKRTFDKKDNNDIESNEHLQSFKSMMSEDIKQESEKMNLLEVLKVIVLNDNSYIHDELENSVSNPFLVVPEHAQKDYCKHARIKCCGIF